MIDEELRTYSEGMIVIDEELRKYYENRFQMTSSEGWKDLIDDLIKMRLATNDLRTVKDEMTLHFRKGEISIIDWIINLHDLSRDTFDRISSGVID